LEITESARRDPGLWFLAEDAATGELAGVCLTRIAPGTGGWIGPVGVRRPWRKRGLGLALLHATFAELHRRGIPAASLSVDADSPTGAPRLYTRAGMHPIQSIILCRQELRAGKDYSAMATDGSGADG
jgi:GNAT superfamily N-acetyltransferase